MFEKLGVSISRETGSEVHIIGFPVSGKPVQSDQIYFHPNAKKPFHRLSLTRIWTPIYILRKVISLRPEILIISTHELLVAAILYRWITGCKIIYDVHENYYYNIRYTKTFPYGIRHLLAAWVRFKERIGSNFIDHFILAEKGYEAELPFARPSIVLQNKLANAILNRYRKVEYTGYTKLLFSGTLAETTGVFKAIEFVSGLNLVENSFTLTITGHCPLVADWNRLQKLKALHPFITLKANRHPIPHHTILNEIQKADFGIIWYPENPSTQSSLPTKLFEYLALNLPILIHHTSESHDLVLNHAAGIALNEPLDYTHLVHTLKAFHYQPVRNDWSWDTEFRNVLPILYK